MHAWPPRRFSDSRGGGMAEAKRFAPCGVLGLTMMGRFLVLHAWRTAVVRIYQRAKTTKRGEEESVDLRHSTAQRRHSNFLYWIVLIYCNIRM